MIYLWMQALEEVNVTLFDKQPVGMKTLIDRHMLHLATTTLPL